jgi:hypothetical protein
MPHSKALVAAVFGSLKLHLDCIGSATAGSAAARAHHPCQEDMRQPMHGARLLDRSGGPWQQGCRPSRNRCSQGAILGQAKTGSISALPSGTGNSPTTWKEWALAGNSTQLQSTSHNTPAYGNNNWEFGQFSDTENLTWPRLCVFLYSTWSRRPPSSSLRNLSSPQELQARRGTKQRCLLK